MQIDDVPADRQTKQRNGGGHGSGIQHPVDRGADQEYAKGVGQPHNGHQQYGSRQLQPIRTDVPEQAH